MKSLGWILVPSLLAACVAFGGCSSKSGGHQTCDPVPCGTGESLQVCTTTNSDGACSGISYGVGGATFNCNSCSDCTTAETQAEQVCAGGGSATCSAATPCGSGSTYQECTVGTGSCPQIEYKTSDGRIFACAGCMDCVAAAQQLAQYCSGSGSSGSSGGGSSSGSSGSSGGGSGSGSGSSSGSSGGGSGSSSGSSSGSGSGGATCPVTSTGGLPLTMSYFSTGAGNPGLGGYSFAYEDTGGSTVCLAGCPASAAGGTISCAGAGNGALCGHGALAANPPPYSTYGGGIGFNLNQAVATGSVATTPLSFAVSGSGISYEVTNIPPFGLRIQIDHPAVSPSTAPFCAPLTTTSGTIPWTSFNTMCYDDPPDGYSLTGPPDDATQIEFQMVSVATPTVDDFCVTSVGFAP